MIQNKYNIPLNVFFHVILVVSTLGMSPQYGLSATINSEAPEGSSLQTGDWLHLERTGPDYCNEKRKTACVSQPLPVERIEQENFQGVFVSRPTNTSRTSLRTPRNLKMIDIYVDQHHRSFRNEIVEIFEQSLASHSPDTTNALHIECHCDDRLTNAYSLSLGHGWAMRAKTFFQFMAFRQQPIHLENFGNLPLPCALDNPDCHREYLQQQSAFRFLAIGKPEMGCLIRLNIEGGRSTPKEFFESHPLFLQKIHVAATSVHGRNGRE